MPLDAITLSGVINELNEALKGGRVDKIHQPERDEIIIHIRSAGKNRKLLFCANPSSPRIHFINEPRENPATPPMFCMLLRKHLQNAKITQITQFPMDRVVKIEFDAVDEMGVMGKKYLVHEIMSRQSNVILYDEEMRIIDAIRRVEGDLSAKRQILPGLFYREPPVQDKNNPLLISKQGITAAVLAENSGIKAEKWIISNFLGFSPLVCREIAMKATLDVDSEMCNLNDAQKEKLAAEICTIVENIKEKTLKPTLQLNEDGTVFDFSFFDITQYGSRVQNVRYSSFSELFDAFYSKKEKTVRIKRRSSDITKTIQSALLRAKRKLAAQEQELLLTAERDKYKRAGDIITANLYQIQQGVKKAELIDYYDEECKTVEIALKPELSPQNNAARYYKLYNKAKTAEKVLTEEIIKGKNDIEYLESVLNNITSADTETDLLQIREELIETSYLSATKKVKGKKKSVVNAPYEYKTRDGFSVFAGKNNLQNDMLTFKTAYKSDMWFHASKMPGSHVILVCDGKKPSLEALNDAAMIAAFHSSGSGKIPVDYTEIRNIKKPPAAKPGMVIYHVYNTAYITATEEDMKEFQKI